MDRLIAQANTPAKAPQPDSGPVPTPHINEPQTATLNSDSENQPLFVSNDVSNFPEALTPNFDSQNLPLFVSTDLSSFQNLNYEINVEPSPSNPPPSLLEETADSSHVGANIGPRSVAELGGHSPDPLPSIYLASIASLDQSLFASSDVSSSIDSTPRQNFDLSITSPLNLPPLFHAFSFYGTVTEGRGSASAFCEGGHPMPTDSFVSEKTYSSFSTRTCGGAGVRHPHRYALGRCSSFPSTAPPHPYSPSKEWQVWYTSF
jgi:hypothetical protein